MLDQLSRILVIYVLEIILCEELTEKNESCIVEIPNYIHATTARRGKHSRIQITFESLSMGKLSRRKARERGLGKRVYRESKQSRRPIYTGRNRYK